MKTSILLAGITAVAALRLEAQTGKSAEPRFVKADRIQWNACPKDLSPGCAVAPLQGSPSERGFFVTRSKFPAGYKIQPHFHGADECVVVISGGPVHIGIGDSFDQSAPSAHTLTPGDFFCLPRNVHHYAWFEGESVIQAQGIGPFGRTYLKASDDPRHK